MAFMIGLIAFFGIGFLISLASGGSWLSTLADKGAFALSAMFVLVGISHFLKPEKLLAMIPPHWPYREAMNYLSGAAEIILGILLLFGPTRTLAAYGLLLLLVAVFPANIYVSTAKPTLYNISRLFFQPLYMAWVWYFCLR
ncbi:DoxX family protein [Longitalea arenae]|uniref:DoxX family protein n=1 Tax=Longitalea arenae TaxID=2812558 RepID=UPI0019681F90|nr:MauE/DoxX family redox-associated membrane protein [Longitalea arenae]